MKKTCLAILMIFFSVLASLASTPAQYVNLDNFPEQTIDSLENSEIITAFLANPAIPKSTISVLITDLDTGKELCCINPDTPRKPASTVKAVTLATFKRKIGKDYKFRTPVMLNGEVRDSLLDGNLLIIGSGDPAMGSSKLDSPDIIEETVDALKKKGIWVISGDVVIDESQFGKVNPPKGWQHGDLGHAYGTLPHSLNFEHNDAGGASVANPSGVLHKKLLSRLRKEGIQVHQNKIDSNVRTLLFNYYSLPVDDIMRCTMMRSDNLFAECLLLNLSLLETGIGTTASGAEIMKEYWEGQELSMEGVEFNDGSGLSRDDRLTARFLSEMLINMEGDVDYVSYFPLTGEQGTVSKFLRGTSLDGYLALKTGSLRDVMCYAGYKLDDRYAPTHVIVILVNSLPQGRDSARRGVADFLIALLGNN